MRRLWPIAEAAQADYERLREQVLDGAYPAGLAAARFERGGLAGLITRPTSAPIWVATLVGATRPRWSPHTDPRTEALAQGYEWLLGCRAEPDDEWVEMAR